MTSAKVLAVIGVLVIVAMALRSRRETQPSYPTPGVMPAEVDGSITEAVERLETSLARHAPGVLEHLQPGLSLQDIQKLERSAGFQLSDELRALYQWRNGVPQRDYTDIMPIHRYAALEETVEAKLAMDRQRAESSFAQRAVDDLVIGHMDHWIPVFRDIAGDGIFYDPNRSPEEGAIFSSFLETGSYQFFPSLKNVLVAISECFESGAYYVGEDGQLDQKYSEAAAIWSKYGVDVNW